MRRFLINYYTVSRTKIYVFIQILLSGQSSCTNIISIESKDIDLL